MGPLSGGGHLSALEIRSLYIKRYINSPSLLYFFYLSGGGVCPPFEKRIAASKCSAAYKATVITDVA